MPVTNNRYIQGMAKQLVRFSFTITEGPHAGLLCGGWRVWCTGEDTYITSKTLAGTWKTSLHGDEAWRTAVTSENMRSDSPSLPPGLDRAPWKYDVPPFLNGKRLAFVVAAARSAMLPGQKSRKEIQIPIEDKFNIIQLVRIWMTEPGVTLEGLDFIGNPLRLRSGRRVWLDTVAESILGSDTSPEEPATGSIVEVLTPDSHGTRSPGLLVKGFRLS